MKLKDIIALKRHPQNLGKSKPPLPDKFTMTNKSTGKTITFTKKPTMKGNPRGKKIA